MAYTRSSVCGADWVGLPNLSPLVVTAPGHRARSTVQRYIGRDSLLVLRRLDIHLNVVRDIFLCLVPTTWLYPKGLLTLRRSMSSSGFEVCRPGAPLGLASSICADAAVASATTSWCAGRGYGQVWASCYDSSCQRHAAEKKEVSFWPHCWWAKPVCARELMSFVSQNWVDDPGCQATVQEWTVFSRQAAAASGCVFQEELVVECDWDVQTVTCLQAVVLVCSQTRERTPLCPQRTVVEVEFSEFSPFSRGVVSAGETFSLGPNECVAAKACDFRP